MLLLLIIVASLMFSLSQSFCWCVEPLTYLLISSASVFLLLLLLLFLRCRCCEKKQSEMQSRWCLWIKEWTRRQKNRFYNWRIQFCWWQRGLAMAWLERPLYENVLKASERKLAKYSNNMINVIQLAAAVVVAVALSLKYFTYAEKKKKKRGKEKRSEKWSYTMWEFLLLFLS